MKINETEMGRNVHIEVVIDGKKLEFDSVIQAIVDETILIDPITKDEKTVGFKNHEALVIYVTSDNKPFAFSGATLTLVKYQGQVFHQITAAGPGSPYNRRKSYRQHVGLEGSINDLSGSKQVVVKDVSAHGCSFVTSEELEVGNNIALTFMDGDKTFVIRSTIVRQFEVQGTGKYVYGCECKMANHKIEKYVTEKQREDLQRHNTSVSDKPKQ